MVEAHLDELIESFRDPNDPDAVGTLKHRFGMARAHYKGDRGFKRYVGWSVIANNLVSIARVRRRRKAQADGQAKKSA